jgi:hypothetical protein
MFGVEHPSDIKLEMQLLSSLLYVLCWPLIIVIFEALKKSTPEK